MSHANRYHAWIDVGYELFADEGYDFVQVERLARIVGRNKSGFYHYFGDRETYMEHIVKHHLDIARNFRDDVLHATALVPDYIDILLRYRQFVMVTMQMSRSNHIRFLKDSYASTQDVIKNSIVPLWATFVGLECNLPLAVRYYEITKDVMNVRITNKDFNFEFFHRLLTEAKSIVNGVHSEGSKHNADFGSRAVA